MPEATADFKASLLAFPDPGRRRASARYTALAGRSNGIPGTKRRAQQRMPPQDRVANGMSSNDMRLIGFVRVGKDRDHELRCR
jgi:hypothetical protein